MESQRVKYHLQGAEGQRLVGLVGLFESSEGLPTNLCNLCLLYGGGAGNNSQWIAEIDDETMITSVCHQKGTVHFNKDTTSISIFSNKLNYLEDRQIHCIGTNGGVGKPKYIGKRGLGKWISSESTSEFVDTELIEFGDQTVQQLVGLDVVVVKQMGAITGIVNIQGIFKKIQIEKEDDENVLVAAANPDPAADKMPPEMEEEEGGEEVVVDRWWYKAQYALIFGIVLTFAIFMYGVVRRPKRVDPRLKLKEDTNL